MRTRKISNLEEVLWKIRAHPPWDLQSFFPDHDLSMKKRTSSGNYYLLCPIIKEKKPSCYYSPINGLIHCFGCGRITSDIIGLYMKLANVDFYPAVIRLAKFFGIKLVWKNQTA